MTNVTIRCLALLLLTIPSLRAAERNDGGLTLVSKWIAGSHQLNHFSREARDGTFSVELEFDGNAWSLGENIVKERIGAFKVLMVDKLSEKSFVVVYQTRHRLALDILNLKDGFTRQTNTVYTLDTDSGQGVRDTIGAIFVPASTEETNPRVMLRFQPGRGWSRTATVQLQRQGKGYKLQSDVDWEALEGQRVLEADRSAVDWQPAPVKPKEEKPK